MKWLNSAFLVSTYIICTIDTLLAGSLATPCHNSFLQNSMGTRSSLLEAAQMAQSEEPLPGQFVCVLEGNHDWSPNRPQ